MLSSALPYANKNIILKLNALNCHTLKLPKMIFALEISQKVLLVTFMNFVEEILEAQPYLGRIHLFN